MLNRHGTVKQDCVQSENKYVPGVFPVDTTWGSISAKVLSSGLVFIFTLFFFSQSSLWKGIKMNWKAKLPCWCYPLLHPSSMCSSHSSTHGLETWRNFRIPNARYMLLLPGICCYLHLVLFAWRWLTLLFYSKLYLGAVVGNSELWSRWIHLPKGFCAIFPQSSVSLL